MSAQWLPTATTSASLAGTAWNLEAIGARDAWQALGWPGTPLSSHRVYVAVVDTGVDVAHPDLQGRIAPWRKSFAEPESDASLSVDSAHGTAMASIIAANGDNGAVGIDGIMWGAQVIPCKVGGGNSGSLGQARKCLEWLERLIDEEQLRIVAINVSFGSDCCDCEMERVVGRLRERGVLLIAAAGNGRKSNDGDNGCPFYPASIPLSNVVSVTGSDTYGNVLYRYGKRRVHVAAPGVNIPVLVPGGGRSMIPGGASAAAAHATGVVALLYAQNPSRPWWELRNLLLSGGIPVSCANDPACALVTGRQLRAWGSGGTGALNCAGQAVRRRLLPVEDRLQRRPGDVVLLRVLSVTCALAQPPPLVRVRPAVDPSTVLAELQLRDDGVAPDEVANDGEYHASWVVPGPSGRDYVLSVADEPVEVHVEEP